MKSYVCTFNGRTNGAIGIFYKILHTVSAKNPEKALLKCFEKYEHISRFNCTETTESKGVL